MSFTLSLLSQKNNLSFTEKLRSNPFPGEHVSRAHIYGHRHFLWHEKTVKWVYFFIQEITFPQERLCFTLSLTDTGSSLESLTQIKSPRHDCSNTHTPVDVYWCWVCDPERRTLTWWGWPVTNRQHQCFGSGVRLAGVQSGFHSVFMILAVWDVCLCLDNSRAQRLWAWWIGYTQPEGWILGLWTTLFWWFVLSGPGSCELKRCSQNSQGPRDGCAVRPVCLRTWQGEVSRTLKRW